MDHNDWRTVIIVKMLFIKMTISTLKLSLVDNILLNNYIRSTSFSLNDKHLSSMNVIHSTSLPIFYYSTISVENEIIQS